MPCSAYTCLDVCKNHLLIFSSFLDIWENVEWPRFFGPPGILARNVGAPVVCGFKSRLRISLIEVLTLSGQSVPWVSVMRYLGIFIVRSLKFKCSLEAAKRSFYRTANSIFGKIGRSASEETTFQLIQSKCIPALLYGLEACPTNKSDLRSLDFVLDRFCMKLFRTSNVAIVRQCQELFGFQLPSLTLCKRVDKFVGKYYASDNLLCKICRKFV